jgi:hypothetical protein
MNDPRNKFQPIIFTFSLFYFVMFISCKNENTLIGEKKVKGLDGTKIEFHQSETSMGTSEIWYNLTPIMENKFLFHTSDNLEIEDIYTNSYDSIIYVSFNKSKDDVLYFIDLKTKLSANTDLTINKDSITDEKFHFLQESLFQAKDSIFRVLYKHNNKLKMTGYNK